MSTQPETEPMMEEKTKKDASPRQIAVIVGAAVLLLILFWFLFLRGGGDEPAEEALPQAPAPTVTDVPGGGVNGDGKGGEKPGDGPVETTEVFASRDPFKPLLSTGSSDGGEEVTGDITGDTTGDTTVDDDGTVITDPDDTTDDTDADPDDTDDGSDTGDDENVEGHTVELVGINGSGDNATAQIQVDGTIYTVEEGETFADNFELLSTSNECATVLFGDDQFTVCEGEEILK